MVLSEEKINLNYVSFVKKLKQYNIYTEKFEKDDNFNELLKNAPSYNMEESGGAYNGSLVEYIKKVALNAYNLNNLFPENLRVNIDSLIKVCYLHQISKAKMYEKNTGWDVKNGKLYSFVNDLPALKMGEMSVLICVNYGIELTDDEFTAILSIDKENDVQTKFFGSTLSFILKTANEMSAIERKSSFIK